MKLTVLTDNTTRIDAYYLGEPGVSYLLETEGKKFLLDTGYSDVYVRNGWALRLDWSKINGVILSHGHNDHTRGLQFLPDFVGKVPLVAHPSVFTPKQYEGEDIGCPMDMAAAADRFLLRLSDKPVWLTERLVFLGEIPRTNDFEGKRPIGKVWNGEGWDDDFLPDDTALAYRGEEGLTIITGCSHAGICNITEYAKQVCGEERIHGIIGGFHLLKMTSRVEKTAAYLKQQNIKNLYPCHCTCFHARAAIHAATPIGELCVGDTLEF